LKRWPPMFGAPIFRLASSFSLLLLIVSAWAYDYQTLDDRLSSLSGSAALDVLRKEEPALDEQVRMMIDDLGDHPSTARIEEVKWTIAQLGMRQGMGDEDPSGAVKRLKANPLFRDQGDKQSSNWLGQAFERLRNAFDRPKPPEIPRGPRLNLQPGGLSWLTGLVWVLLGAAVVAFAYFALKHVSFKRGLKRRRTAVLDEDEPERSLDEWLGEADALAAQGMYREAVRALYLACLLKFDERKVARFIRAETNWEHLARIQTSATLPPGLDFRPPTKAFDSVWYGRKVEGLPDVDRFRSWYQQVKGALEANA